MIPALARFVDALRAEGVPVSPAEAVDASRALDVVGLASRAAVRAALRATLVKDRARLAAFDALFDRFFAPPPRRGAGEGAGRPGGRGTRPRPGPPRAPQGPAGGPGPDRRLAGDRPGPREGDRRAGERGASREPQGERRARRSELVPAAVPAPGERRDGRLRRVLRAREAAGGAAPSSWTLAGRLTTDEERRIAREVPRLVREIRLRPGRRLERARTGRPWLRQVLRENLSRGGVPFVVPYRKPKPRTTRIVLLVDVSHSVARAAGLFLLLAGAFATLARRARVVAFVDRPVDVTAAVARWTAGRATPAEGGAGPAAVGRRGRAGAGIASGRVSFADLLEGVPALNLDAPSDYGRAFHALLASRRRPRGRNTVLVVLGDGRTNRFDPTAWALDELARGVRLTFWLVPEPRSRWGTGDSALPDYLPAVDVAAETSDLDGLARAVAALARTLR